jgi:hypothetical protein
MGCPAYCVKFSTCNNNEEARETEKILSACWDNIKNIKLDKRYNCYSKFHGSRLEYYNYGTCPECEDVYINRIDEFPPVYEELTEICRNCKKEK